MLLTISGRIFIQKLWRAQQPWDKKLENELVDEWKLIAQNLNKISDIKLPRQVSSSNPLSLHIFSDASLSAYGCVAYLVSDESSNLVMAKVRVAPIKCPTLPQLELTALNLAARLADFILNSYKDNLKIEEVVLWSDSTIALS